MLRNVSRCLALVASLSVMACLEPAEPTAVSAEISITPVSRSVAAVDLSKAVFFRMDMSFRSTSSRTVYIDSNQRFLEKLIDQKWVFAYTLSDGPFRPSISLSPQMSTVIQNTVTYLKGSTPEAHLFDRPRGVYRQHFRVSVDAAGVNILDSASTYSRPFAVE